MYQNTCVRTIIAVLFKMAKDYKTTQIAINGKVKKYVVYLHNGIPHSNGKGQWLMHAAAWMDARCIRVYQWIPSLQSSKISKNLSVVI